MISQERKNGCKGNDESLTVGEKRKLIVESTIKKQENSLSFLDALHRQQDFICFNILSKKRIIRTMDFSLSLHFVCLFL